MSIKLTILAIAAVLALVATAKAATVDCTIDYPNGTHAGNEDGAIFYPNGAALRTPDGEMQYPNGAKLLSVEGAMSYPDGSELKAVDGSMKYQNGSVMRDSQGGVFQTTGKASSLAIANIIVDPATKLIARAFANGSSYRLYLKTDANSLIVDIDDQANVTCEFVKPIGH